MGEDERKTVIGAWEYDLDLEIVWSEEFANILVQNGYLPAKHVFAAGAVTFDQYFTPPMRARVEGRRNLVFCTNWAHADRNAEYNVPEAPPDSPIHADAYNRHREGRERWTEMIRLARERLSPQWQFFLSLKVGEHPTEYQQKLGGVINILAPTATKVVIMNADLIIHAGSTLGLVCHVNNMPALSYMGQQNHTKGYKYPHVSPNFDDSEELVEAIKQTKLECTNANIESVEELTKELYGRIDGKACKRAVDKMLSLPERKTNVPDVWPPETKEYSHPGIGKQAVTWICETCKRPCYTLDPKRDMISCVHCGVGLARQQPNIAIPPQAIPVGVPR